MRIVLSVLLIVVATGNSAAAAVYECRAQQRSYSSDFWSPFDNLIQPQMRFTIEEASATVEDPLIRSVHGGAIPGDLTENTDKKWVVRWSMTARGDRGRQATQLFRASFIKKSAKLIVTQAVSGANTTFHGRGSCVEVTGTG